MADECMCGDRTTEGAHRADGPCYVGPMPPDVSGQQRIELSGGGYVLVHRDTLEVGWEGGTTSVLLTPDEQHELSGWLHQAAVVEEPQ